MSSTPQFTTGQLFLWTFYFATFFALFSALPTTSSSFVSAAFAAVVFAVLDLWCNKHFPGWLGVSYFACALAYVVAIGFVILLSLPATEPPKPALTFFAGLYNVLSGNFMHVLPVNFMHEIMDGRSEF